ncbi:hypothetical protein [Nocardia bovistercoris]|uniref:Uncharacterized protein n=1 Tax=Nocardia bovistercoris TaxID=2785916 RepID=A0A931IES8_9NOCA|nr:hypothetical protein [Nocardia bovistercoris]MBH0780372.1 hypothetical protein [Nocardia bovistercoris]
MATYIDLGGGQGYLNAASVIRIKLESPNRVTFLTARQNPCAFDLSVLGPRSGQEILQDLLVALGHEEKYPETRVISLEDGKVRSNYLH